MGQLTSQGYQLTNQNTWFDEEQQLYVNIDPNWNLDPSTPDGIKIAHDSEVFSALDESVMQAYNSKDPNKADGTDLNIICALTGTKRSKGTYSDVVLTFTGTVGSVVTSGAIVESATTGYRFTVNQNYTIDSTGTVDANATCNTIGQIEASSGTLTKIITTMSGISAVTNAEPATPGTSQESNASLRQRRKLAVGRPGNNQVSSLLGEILVVTDVRKAKVYENDTDSSDIDELFNPYGLPQHSVAIIVDGGSDDDVAYAVYIKKNPGCKMAGVATVVDVLVTDKTYPTNTKVIRFNRPEYIDMVLNISIKDTAKTLPENVDQLIKDAFIEFANGSLVASSVGFKSTGFDIGESVPYSTLFTPINKVIGQYGNAYVSELLVNGNAASQTINYNQLSRWTEDNITVTVS